MKSRTIKILRIFVFFAALIGLVWLVGSTQLTQAADPVWTAQYWNNKTLTGTPVLTRTENNLNYDWGTGSPSPGIVNSDNFSAYWRRSINFSAGSYTFTATTDDGMRVWVDGTLLIDSWTDSQVHSITKNINLSAGDHLIEVRYYEAGGQAVAKLSWINNGSAPPTTISNFRGEYFNNMTLSGSPVLIRDDYQINFDWGIGSPDPVVPADRFSVRWTRTQSVQSGKYRFTVIADDGVRLWVNGQLVIDKWIDSYEGTYFAEVDIPGGSVNVQMEYYENIGGALARMSWLRIGDSTGSGGSNWRGEYFNNQSLSGSPVLVRDDGSLNFNWGSGSPSPGVVNSDNFSARWTRSMYFSAGRYRFTATADDGVRVWVNNQQLINAWVDQAPTTYNGEINLNSGTVPVRVEYYEGVGGARINFSWTLISSNPTPPPPTPPPPSSGEMYGIVQSPRLNVRTGPGLNYTVLAQLVEDQQVTLVGYRTADNGWVMIYWQGGTAWVSGRPGYLWTNVPVSSLTIWTGQTTPPTPPSGGTGGVPTGTVVNCLYLNVRSGPGVSNGVVTVVPVGTVATLLGRNSSSTWTKIQLSSGTVGWVSTTYLNESVPLSTLPVVN